MTSLKDNKGFTLIEISVVLVIIGLLVGLGSSMIGPMTNFVRVRETKDIQDAALQSIISWASSNNKIPDAAGFTNVAKSSLDAWGNNLVYLYDANLFAASPTKDTICGRRSTALTLVSTDPAATVNNVAFAVLSAADNAAFKSKLGSADITASIAATGTINVIGPNSDLARWVTLDELRGRIGCQGAPLKILNNELPVGKVASTYNATITADGGVPFAGPKYGWCIKTSVDGTAPAGLAFNGGATTGNPLFKANCDESNPVAVAAWPQDPQLVLSGSPTPNNSYFFTVYASDNNANMASKSFVLTVNPQY